ncbi:pilin [bacterium]|nr:pilin [bacterium]
MFKIKSKQIFILIAIVFLLSPCCFILAGESPNLTNSAGFLHDAGNSAGYSDDTDMEPILGKIIKTLLSFLGVVFFILIVYGGFIWMTAGGNTDKVGTAKKIIINSIIGLTVVMFAYAITWYIVSQLVESTGFTN